MDLIELRKVIDKPEVCLITGGRYVPEHVYLTVRKERLPTGRTVSLCKGGRGPRGKICNAKLGNAGYDVVAVFKRQAIDRMLRGVGV